jgi:CTP:molybdopterin cytidylyltransferase MocA
LTFPGTGPNLARVTEASYSSIIPIVLAAGRSERMGQPKLLMEFDGKKAITLVIEACITSALGPPIIVLGHFREKIEPLLPTAGVSVVFNPDYTLGQTTSVKAGVRALPENAAAFLIFPADMPLITAADLRALASAFLGRTDPARTIWAPSYHDRGGHPVLVDIALKKEFLDLDDLEPISAIIRKDRARRAFVPVTHRGILVDMDTRRDYDTAVREYRSGGRGSSTRRKTVPTHAAEPTGTNAGADEAGPAVRPGDGGG